VYVCIGAAQVEGILSDIIILLFSECKPNFHEYYETHTRFVAEGNPAVVLIVLLVAETLLRRTGGGTFRNM
jgi:hypothetical protein